MAGKSEAALRLSAVAGATGLGACAVWLWRHQGELAMRRPFNEWTFTHMSTVMPTETVLRSGPEQLLPYKPDALDVEYEYAGQRRALGHLHANTNTTGFAVLHRGVLVHECYPGRFASSNTRFQLFSVTKSVTSILMGIAMNEGAIGSLDEPVSAYCPDLAGSAYDGPAIGHLLHMSSGVGGLEVYTDPGSLINQFERAITGGGSVRHVIRSAPRVSEPGTSFNYSTLDTQVLGWVLEAATGMSLATYAAERLWSRIGAERDAYYFLTRKRPRTAIGGGSLNATVRDMARVGLLMARGGVSDGEQIVPASWVERSRGAGLAHLKAGALGPSGVPHYGYSNQWWTVDGERRSFTALGVHGQYVWVDPDADVVIVKTSAWPSADDLERDAETYAAFTAIVAHLEGRG